MPKSRFISGFSFSLLPSSFALADVIPSSSPACMAFRVHETMSAQLSSPSRTTGPRGSLEMISGRMTWASGSSNVARVDARPDPSVVYTSQRPAR